MVNFGEIQYDGKTVNLDRLTEDEMKKFWFQLEADNNKLIQEQNTYLSEIL